jgi:hypothetical protein
MELQQTNRELIKEREILRSRIDAVPKRETHSTMTSPPYVSAATDAASAMSLEVTTDVSIVRHSHIIAKCLKTAILIGLSVHLNTT